MKIECYALPMGDRIGVEFRAKNRRGQNRIYFWVPDPDGLTWSCWRWNVKNQVWIGLLPAVVKPGLREQLWKFWEQDREVFRQIRRGIRRSHWAGQEVRK